MNRNTALTATAALDDVIARATEARALIAPFTIAQPVQEKPADPLSPPAVFVIPDVEVLPGERVAYVRVQLAEPVPRQLRATFATTDGTAKAGSATASWTSYAKTTADLIFLPGETEKVVEVPLHRDLGAATFKVSVNHSLNNPPVKAAIASVRQVEARDMVKYRKQPTFAPVDGREGRVKIYSTDFTDLSQWNKRGGFHQGGNKELALYCDPAMKGHEGFDPHPLVDGKRVLRMIRQSITVNIDGRDQTFPYRAPMLRMDKPEVYIWKHGDHIELDAIIPPNTGGVPAFWGAAGNPYVEIDGFEFGLGGNPGLMSTIHWGLDKGTAMEGVMTTHIPDGLPHTYSVTRGDDWLVTKVDGIEVHRRPAIFKDRDLPIIINNTTGGILRSDPKWPLGKTEDIVLGEFRAYRKVG